MTVVEVGHDCVRLLLPTPADLALELILLLDGLALIELVEVRVLADVQTVRDFLL